METTARAPAALKHLGSDIKEMLREQRDYYELLIQMTLRDLRLRYKQSIMGFGWAILMPVTHMIVFSIIFTRVASVETKVAYPVFAYCGLLPWNFLNSSLKFSANSLTSQISLVTKVYFAKEILPFSAVLVSLVDLAVASTVLAGLMIYYGIALKATILFLPLLLLVQVMLVTGLALLLAMGNLFYRDVKYITDFFILGWMYSTAVLYPLDKIEGLLGDILRLNPMTIIIDGYRGVILYGELPDMLAFGAVSAFSALLLLVAWLTFHRAEYRFAERV